MKVSRILHTVHKSTFGDVLPKNTLQGVNLKLKKPAGFDILETKFPRQLNELNTFFQDELSNNETKTFTKDQVMQLIEKYITHGIINEKNKKMTPVQRKLLMTAYAKAGKSLPPGATMNVGKAGRMKLGLLMKRNWPFLNFVSKSNGLKISDGDEVETWNFDGDEFEEEGEEEEKPSGEISDSGYAVKNTSLNGGNFNSMLKNLNKVHQTQMIHVLPSMTEFRAAPTIKNVEIGEEEVKNLEHFLHDAKHKLDEREENLFKAETNLELTTNMIQRHPKSFAHGNFFDPICIPTTLIGLNEKLLTRINTKQVSLVKTDDLSVMRLQLNEANELVENDILEWSGEIENVYAIFQKLKQPHLFQSQFLKLVKLGWIPVTSAHNEIIFVRDKKQHQLIWIKRGTFVGIMGFLVVFGLSGINV